MEPSSSFLRFEDWLDSTSLEAALQFRDKLRDLGVSAESFRDPSSAERVADMLVAEGFPRFPAREIVSNAFRFFQKQNELAARPLGVFWDAENVAVPARRSGLECKLALQSALASFGVLDRINVYLNVAGGTLKAEKRSEMQQSGCWIIDTPHWDNRKEVADKMIIVDVLLYAMQHREGASICIITGDRFCVFAFQVCVPCPHFAPFWLLPTCKSAVCWRSLRIMCFPGRLMS